MAEIVSILSGKGGVGKSTIVSALGYSLAAEGKRTLIAELDLGLRGLDLMLSLSDRIVFDLGDLLCGRCTLSDALVCCICTRPMVHTVLSLPMKMLIYLMKCVDNKILIIIAR